MRKVLAIGTALAMVLIGFMAMAAPVAADCGDVHFTKEACPVCGSPGEIHVGDEYAWVLTITVTNHLGYTMEDAVVKDRLGGELGADDPSTDTGTAFITTKGKTAKVFLTWEIGDLPSGSTATLTMMIYTDTNPGGNQEYTSPGDYMLNSGATLKYFDPTDELQHSLHTGQIMITVLP